MIKSRILALALIGIIWSSTPLSLADAYTISFSVNKLDTTPLVVGTPKNFQINLVDNVSTLLTEYDGTDHKIKIFDQISGKLDDKNNRANDKIPNQKLISIKIYDVVGTNSTDYNNDNRKIILIKINFKKNKLKYLNIQKHIKNHNL